MKTYIVDSFTDKPFASNPAGVCLAEAALSDEDMLLVAQELGSRKPLLSGKLTALKNGQFDSFRRLWKFPYAGTPH